MNNQYIAITSTPHTLLVENHSIMDTKHFKQTTPRERMVILFIKGLFLLSLEKTLTKHLFAKKGSASHQNIMYTSSGG
jgi:hypothetical protein